jgi:hypothetical protein
LRKVNNIRIQINLGGFFYAKKSAVVNINKGGFLRIQRLGLLGDIKWRKAFSSTWNDNHFSYSDALKENNMINEIYKSLAEIK